MQTVRQIGALLLLGCCPAVGRAWAAGGNPNPRSGFEAAVQQSAPSHPATDTTEGDLRDLRLVEENYLRAEMEDDSQLAASLIADDYIGVIGNGGTFDKRAILDRLNQHMRSRQPYRITAVNMEEHVFGDTACVTYTKIYSQPNSQATYSENVLHILTKRNGAWRLQVSSPIPPPKP